MSDSEDTCAICFDTISIESLLSKKNDNTPKKMMSLDCKHKYHINCIEEWSKKSNTCPICRSPIKKEENIIIPRQETQQNTPIRQDQYVNIGHQLKKNKIVLISLILLVLAIINFIYFYTISYQYINDFKDYLSNNTMNCSIVINDIVINKDCPQLSSIDLTFIILDGLAYGMFIVHYLITYSINKKISIIPFIIINTICGLCVGLYYIIHFVSQFQNINIYYTNNPCFNSSIERNFIISVVIFYVCFIIYILTYIYV